MTFLAVLGAVIACVAVGGLPLIAIPAGLVLGLVPGLVMARGDRQTHQQMLARVGSVHHVAEDGRTAAPRHGRRHRAA